MKPLPRVRSAGLRRLIFRLKPGVRLIALLLATAVFPVAAAEVIPPRPSNHFNDYAGVVQRETASKLNTELAQFERETSNQLLVAVFPRMQSDSSVEDYTVRVAQAWAAGTKERKNGAVLFVFQQSHDIRIQTGYGLEGALPDALCKQIIENEIVPRFRAGDFDGGLTAGVHAIMAATRGEYRGTGRSVNDTRGKSASGGASSAVALAIFLIVMFVIVRRQSRRSVVYGPRGRRGIWMGPGPWIGGGGGWGGGGGFGSSGGGGGTFSAGGGSFGGGGAGGRW